MSKQVKWILAIFFCLLKGIALQKGIERRSFQGNIDSSGSALSNSVKTSKIGL